MKHLKYIVLALSAWAFAGCNDFLDKQSPNIIDPEVIFADEKMVESVMANLYARTEGWDRFISDGGGITLADEGVGNWDDNRINIEFNLWGVYDYDYIRNINQLLRDLRATTSITDNVKAPIEGEARFLRAYCYFQGVKAYGGMPIIGDVVYDYKSGQNVTEYHIARSTEAATWQYVIDEFEAAARLLKTSQYKNQSRANKWAALGMKARAAIYAGSIAQHTARHSNAAALKTPGMEAGIDPAAAVGFYQTALNAAEELIKDGPYQLQKNPTSDANRARAFYEATSVKENNTEVIWAFDRITPGKTTGYTNQIIPYSMKEDIDGANITALLNVVEDFQYKDGSKGTLKGVANRINANGNNIGLGEFRVKPTDVIIYEKTTDLFADKDPRLDGTVIIPGGIFKEKEIIQQAGLAIWEASSSSYKMYTANGSRGATAANGDPEGVASGTLIISHDGPFINNSSSAFENKSGFHIRKFLDEKPYASVRGAQQSSMWSPRIRLADVYLIAAEAMVGGATSAQGKTAKDYINVVRDRAGIKLFTTEPTFEDIVQERRAELTFEDQRYWDTRRWRIADQIWKGTSVVTSSLMTALYPFKIYRPGHADHNKWIFVKQRAEMQRYPKLFKVEGYYVPIAQDWINRNPLLTKNPYQ